MKGQLEDDVKKLGFRSLYIMRPPSLIRKGTDRFGESVSVKILQAINKIGLLRSIRSMPTSQVAHTMISLSKQAKEGTFTFDPKDIWDVL